MLINHLGNSISQKYHVLVERLYLSLKLDAVDQINGHRHMLFAKDVEEGVL
jgi:hypothetical protein